MKLQNCPRSDRYFHPVKVGVWVALLALVGQLVPSVAWGQLGSSDGSSGQVQTGSPTPTPTPTAGSSTSPTLTTVDYQVPDCPGVTRKINALHLPPSIYAKACGSSSGSGSTAAIQVGNNGLGKPTGQYGTGLGAPPAGSLFWVITGNQVYPISQGYGLTNFADTSSYGQSAYGYCAAYGEPGHCGVDIGTPFKTKTYTPVAGTVVCAGTGISDGEDGCISYNYSLNTTDSVDPSQYPPPTATSGRFQIKLADGSMLVLGHMYQIDVKAGDKIAAGTYIGLSGGENGPHIHVEYRQIDPSMASGFHTYDPREIFGVPAGSTSQPQGTTTTTTTTPASAQTTSAPAASMVQLEQKYGFNAPTGKSDKDFAKYAQNFAKERDLAAKFAPTFNVDPEMVVWWTWFETLPPYDSYSYNNCGDATHALDVNCSNLEGGSEISAQIGYGEQLAPLLSGSALKEAFTAAHGNGTDAGAVQLVGQQVLDASGIKKTFPKESIDQLMSGANASVATDANYWIYTLGRDPDISAYMLAHEVRGDLDAHPGELYRDIVESWDGTASTYYHDHWQEASNVMGDIVANWGTATVGGTITSSNCPVTATVGTASCSSIPDTFNGGESVAEAISRMNANMADYKKIAACANVPWQAAAAINHMEADFYEHITDSQGHDNPWQFDPLPTDFNYSNFVDAGCRAMKLLQEKAQEGQYHKALTQNMDPTNADNANLLKDAFWGYNGRAEFTENQPGCTTGADCSPYVMGQWDQNHVNMHFSGTEYGVPTGEIPQPYDGTWKLYYELYFSTFDASGNILVLGGKCSQANGVTNGLSLPTAQQIAITSQFFMPDHIGIDIANLENNPVFAMVEGDIVGSGWTDVGGYYLLEHFKGNADNPKERWIYYGHLSPDGLLANGSHVTAGQQIAKTGAHTVLDPTGILKTNGQQTAPHLHFDIRTQPSESTDPSGHVNPCSVDLFKTGYPTLDCSQYPGKGVSWN